MNALQILIHQFIEDEYGGSLLEEWLVGVTNHDAELNSLALEVGRLFVLGEINFDDGNSLLNTMMPIVGFDRAPETFWKFYVGFEDFEVVDNPDELAKQRISQLLAEVNKI